MILHTKATLSRRSRLHSVTASATFNNGAHNTTVSVEVLATALSPTKSNQGKCAAEAIGALRDKLKKLGELDATDFDMHAEVELEKYRSKEGRKQ